MNKAPYVVFATGLVLGAVLSRLLWVPQPNPQPRPSTTEADRSGNDRLQAFIAASHMRSASADSITRGELRSEVERAVRAALDNRSVKKENPAPPPLKPENMVAERRGQELIDTALAHREWGTSEAHEFRKVLEAVTDDQREQLLQKLTVTLNSGRVAVQTHGLPF